MASRSFIDYLLNPGPDEVELQEAIRSAAGVADDIAAAFVAIDAAVAATAADAVTINAQVTYIDGVVATFTTDASAAIAAIAADRASALTAIGTARSASLTDITDAEDAALLAINALLSSAETAISTGLTDISDAVTAGNASLAATGAGIVTDLNIIKADTEELRNEAQIARDEAVGAAAAVDLPPILPGDSGKSLRVKPTEDGFELSDAPALPDGGAQGQYLVKASADDQDAEWGDPLSATEMQKGVAELATAAETIAGSDTEKIVVPAALHAFAKSILAYPPPQGRLSLTPNTPLPTSDVIGATSIHFVAALGTKMGIFDGADIVARDFGSQVTCALDSNTGHSGYQVANINHDIWGFWDGAQVRIGTGPQWTAGPVPGSNTVRGSGSAGTTEIEMIDGLPVNKNDIQVRFGAASGDVAVVPARRATLLGTVRPTAAGQATDTETRRLLANAQNQAPRKWREVIDTTASWTYSTAAMRFANNNANTKAELLFAFGGNALSARMLMQVDSSTATNRVAGGCIYVDGADVGALYINVNSSEIRKNYVFADRVLSEGFHTIQIGEYGGGADVQNWIGNTQRMTGFIYN